MDEPIQLGDRAKDTVTGYEGIVTAETRYLNGCQRFQLEAADTEGKPLSYWFDAETLEVTESEAWTRPSTERPAPGGPRSAPPRTSH